MTVRSYWEQELATLGPGLGDGASYLLGAPLAVAALLATCLLLATARRPLPASAIVLLVAAATLTRFVAVVDQALIVPCILIALGSLLALGCTARGRVAPLVAVAGGVAAGLGGGMQVASWQEIAGGDAVLVAMFLLASVAAAKAPPLGRFTVAAGVGRRMAGAWIAAIGVLMLALWWRAAQGGAPLLS